MKESYKLLKEEAPKFGINFIGNVEGREAFSGEIDAVVTDGFTGNIAVKTTEGLGKALGILLKEELTSSVFRKIGTAILSVAGAIGSFKKRIDYSEYGGALLLGIEKPIVKCHGSGKEKDIKIVLKQAENFVKGDVVEGIKEAITEK